MKIEKYATSEFMHSKIDTWNTKDGLNITHTIISCRQTVANFIVGKLNSSLFHCDSKQECPEDIFVPNTTLFYR